MSVDEEAPSQVSAWLGGLALGRANCLTTVVAVFRVSHFGVLVVPSFFGISSGMDISALAHYALPLPRHSSLPWPDGSGLPRQRWPAVR